MGLMAGKRIRARSDSQLLSAPWMGLSVFPGAEARRSAAVPRASRQELIIRYLFAPSAGAGVRADESEPEEGDGQHGQVGLLEQDDFAPESREPGQRGRSRRDGQAKRGLGGEDGRGEEGARGAIFCGSQADAQSGGQVSGYFRWWEER